MGRLIHNFITILFIFVLAGVSMNLVDSFYKIGSYANLLILSIFPVVFAEFVLSLVNLTLTRFFKLAIW